MEKIGGFLNMAGVAILMNLLFLAACLPIVTIGQAWCGLMGAIRYNIRGEKWITGFWVGFKTRFFRGTVAWILGLLTALFFLNDIAVAMAAEATVPMLASCFMFAMSGMLLMSSLCLNVYIPTSVGNWIRNTVNLMGRNLIQMLIVAGLFWLPVIVFCLVDGWIIYELALVLICAYYALVALVCTTLMKDGLTAVLLQARADGTLTAEEGAAPVREENHE